MPLLAALAAASLAAAAPPPVYLDRADVLTHDVETGRTVATGDVRIRRDSFVLEAETAVLRGTFVEAEGDVRVTDGVDLLTGTRATYDLADGSGSVDGARGTWAGVNVAADRLLISDSRTAVAEGGLISPCSFEDAFAPAFKAKRFEILRGSRIRARLLRVQIGPVPIFFFPLLSLPAPAGGLVGTRTAPSVRFAAGRGDFDGIFAKSGVDFDVGPWGDGTIHVDFRDRVGWALGETHRLDFPRGSGVLRTQAYWVDVRDASNRSRFRAQYLGDLSERLSFRGQVHRVSDRAFLRDFFFREFAEEEPPAYDATLAYRGLSWTARLSWVGNGNRDEFTETERMPEAEVRLLPRRIAGGFVVEGDASAARLGLEDENGGDTEFARTRGRLRLSRPTPLGGVFTLTPFAAADVAHYSRDDRVVRGGTRSLPSVGATLETLLVGRWGDRARHILRPSATFEHVERKGLNPIDIIVRDPEDRPRDGDVVSFEVDNHFVRRRRNGEARRIGRILLSTFWDADRRGPKWGDVRLDARLSPTERTIFSLDAAHDPNANIVRRADLSAGYRADSWGASFHLIRSDGRTPDEDQLQAGGDVTAALTDRWSGRLRASFDLEEGTLDSARYGLTYRGPCWTLGLGFEDQRQIDRDLLFFQLGLTPFGDPAEVEFGGL